MMLKLLMVAGDYSGDMHGASLCNALHHHAKDTSVHITALGGNFLEKEADVFLGNLVHFEGFGFFKPFSLIFTFRKILKSTIKQYLIREKPNGIILIDYYGFNIHVASLAHRLSIPVIYFISPQVWASRSYRIRILRKFVRMMLVIFPFEEKLYRDAGVPATFIGHPLLDRLPQPRGIPNNGEPWHIGLLPGSRPSEIKRHLPVLLDAARRISMVRTDTSYSLFIPNNVDERCLTALEELVNAMKDIHIAVIRDEHYVKRNMLTFALTASGTATLENALLGIPMIVIYKTSWFTYMLAMFLIRVPYICVVNILLNKYVVPEFIQHRASSRNIAQKAVEVLSRNRGYNQVREVFAQVRSLLGHHNAVQHAAEIIVQELKS